MLLERKGRVASRCRFDSLSLHSDNTAHSDASEHWRSCCSRQLCCWFKGITNLSILTHVSTLNTGETEKTDDEFMVSLSCRVNWRSVHASWDPLLKRTKLPKKKSSTRYLNTPPPTSPVSLEMASDGLMCSFLSNLLLLSLYFLSMIKNFDFKATITCVNFEKIFFKSLLFLLVSILKQH